MVAHYHGQRWNAAEFARSLGSSEATGRRYLDILAGAYMVRLLPAWFENVGKRQVKAPKLYIRDTGILHSLLGLETLEDVQSHPRLGASWEGFVIEQILCLLGAREAYFWAMQDGAELDLLIMARGRRSALKSNTPTRLASAAPCASRSAIWRSLTCGWCIQASKATA